MAKFFIIALTVMLVMQGFVSWHVWRMLPFSTPVKLIVLVLMLLALACMVLQFKSDSLPLGMATAMYEIGNSWLIIMFYLLMAFLVLDIGRLVHLVPATWLRGNAITSLVLTGLMLVTFIAGNIHYHNKQRQEINLTTDKHLERPLKIVMLSDLHAGFHNRRAEVGRWVNMINAEKADLILIAGDMIDGNVRPLLAQGTAKELQRLNAPTIACLGNHEYITGIDKALNLLEQTGIRILRDKSISVGDVTIIGRDDRSNRSRKSVARLMQGVTRGDYIILLDHQPFNLAEAEQNGVDLQLSGHTHRGQVWPLNWVTKKMYECDYGQWRKGKT
ncbi:MAG: metallophosphoesterase, partial [Muribaculaceae bacterium]|nr:metallophosphoesterase [Muribaculaceae bacterium]